MTKAELRAEKLLHQHRRQRRQRLRAEARRNQAEREAQTAAARAVPPRWLAPQGVSLWCTPWRTV
jgi:hypothetical protein